MSQYSTDSSKWNVEPDAWVSIVQCTGPMYGKKEYDSMPHQSLNPPWYKHEKLFAEKTVIGLMKSAYYDGYTAREQETRNAQNVCHDKNCITHDEWYAKCNELSASQAREAEFQRVASNATFDLQSVRKDLFQAQQEIAELRKLLEESKVTEGWQLVPKSPTEQMLKATSSVYDTDAFGSKSAWPSDIYKAMLAAAPQPKEPKR